jgi:photosystem II stability/assembly factor-like uncharacterized protein
MKKLITLLLLLLLSEYSFAQLYLEQVSNTTANLTSVHTTNWGDIAWACGYNGTVIRTQNGGNNWFNVSGNGIPTNVNLINIYGLNASTALAAGYIGTNTYVYRTSNAGANWSTVFSQSNGFINASWIRQDSVGFMYGDPVGSRWSLWKTTNAGLNWDSAGLYLPQAGSETGWNNSLFLRDSSLWFGTNNSRIYYSSNFGTNWQIQSTAPEQNVYSIWFYWIPYYSSWGRAGGNTLLYTSNNGMNWAQDTTATGTGIFGGFTGNPPGVYGSSFPEGTFWYTRSDNKLYFSWGYYWQADYTAPSGSYNCLSLGVMTGLAFAVRNNGGITRIITQWGAVKSISGKIPSGYKLYQNYPNPFNPKSTIRFAVLKPGNVKIIIYDIQGREVSSLVNQQMMPGTYEVNWDAGNYPSGAYFYRMITTEYTETKKMVLIK